MSDSTDYVGYDIGNAEADDCCAKYQTFSGCTAFSWTNQSSGACWLNGATVVQECGLVIIATVAIPGFRFVCTVHGLSTASTCFYRSNNQYQACNEKREYPILGRLSLNGYMFLWTKRNLNEWTARVVP